MRQPRPKYFDLLLLIISALALLVGFAGAREMIQNIPLLMELELYAPPKSTAGTRIASLNRQILGFSFLQLLSGLWLLRNVVLSRSKPDKAISALTGSLLAMMLLAIMKPIVLHGPQMTGPVNRLGISFDSHAKVAVPASNFPASGDTGTPQAIRPRPSALEFIEPPIAFVVLSYSLGENWMIPEASSLRGHAEGIDETYDQYRTRDYLIFAAQLSVILTALMYLYLVRSHASLLRHLSEWSAEGTNPTLS